MKYLLFAILALFSSVTASATTSDDEQDRLYLQCLIKRKVDPNNIPNVDNVTCIKAAGLEDPGDDRRRETGDAWRACLIKKAAELDDEISPATDIAKAIVILCPNEWIGYVGSYAMYPRAKREVASDVSKYGLNEGVQAVLLTRRVRREMQ